MRCAAAAVAPLLAAMLVPLVGGAVVNTDVVRTLDLTTAIPKCSITIHADGVDGEYVLAFPTALAERMSLLTVKSVKESVQLQPAAPREDGELTYISVFPGAATVHLKVVALFTDVLRPFPKEVAQGEPQLVLYDDNVYVSSPYPTNKQKTVVKLASTTVESATRMSPMMEKGSTITYGEFENVPALTVEPLKLHFMNNKPFAKLTEVVREIEVSHWGNVAVEDIYELQHAGAALKGGFSRIEFQMMRRSSDSPHFRMLRATLPAEATNIYYRDQIGNISTSDIRVQDGNLELDVNMRFPLFGGWKSEFYIGYSLPTTLCLTKDQDSVHRLRLPFFVPFEDVWVEDMTVKVVLPEGATDVKVELPYEVEMDSARRFTFLDTVMSGGRPVVILKGKNFVDEHTAKLTVSYKFDSSSMLTEPVMLVAFFFGFHVVCIVAARLKLGFSKAP